MADEAPWIPIDNPRLRALVAYRVVSKPGDHITATEYKLSDEVKRADVAGWRVTRRDAGWSAAGGQVRRAGCAATRLSRLHQVGVGVLMSNRDPYRQHGRKALCSCGHVDIETFTTCASCRPGYLRRAVRRARHAGKREAHAATRELPRNPHLDAYELDDFPCYDGFYTEHPWADGFGYADPLPFVALATIGDKFALVHSLESAACTRPI